MGLFNRFKSFISGNKEINVKNTPEDRTSVQKPKKENFFNRFTNLFKPKKETKVKESKKIKPEEIKKENFFNRFTNLFKPKKEPEKEPEKDKVIKPNMYGIDTSKIGYSIYNNAKKPYYDIISDISVRVKLETSKGVQFRHWGIYSDNEKISNKEIIETIENDIFINKNVYSILTTSGETFTVYNFSIISAYRNQEE